MSFLSRFRAHAGHSVPAAHAPRRARRERLAAALRCRAGHVDRLESRVLFADVVSSFSLINADTDQPIAGYTALTANATIDLGALPTKNLNVRANTNPASVGSVRFRYDSNTSYRTDNSAPYALSTESGANYSAWTPSVGSHALSARPYTSSNARGTAGTALTITLTVVNNPVISVAATDASAAETNGGQTANTGTFTITRTGLTTASRSVNLAMSGAATNGSDYASIPTTVTIPAGSASTTVVLRPTNDSAVEGSESAVLGLLAGTGYAVKSGAASATVTIADNDAAPTPAPTITINDVTQNEGLSGLTPFVFTVTRAGSLSNPSTVNFATGGGTGNPANDYRATSGVVSFAAGESTKTITVQVDGDAFVETDNTFFVNLSGGTNVAISDAQGLGTILNDDPTSPAPVTVSLTTADANASETGPDAGSFTVTRTGPTTAALTVNLSAGGSATNGTDYAQVLGTVTIPAGSASATVAIAPVDDGLVEGAESASLSLLTGAGYQVSTTNNSGTVTIADDDVTPPTGQQPWTTSFAAPTTIEAEFYDKGGEGVAYHDLDPANQNGSFRLTEGVDVETSSDAGGGYNLGHVQAGEWTEYTFNLTQAGRYDIGIRFATESGGGTAHVEIGGVNVTGTIALTNTGGWQTWQTFFAQGINLAAGQNQVLRLAIDSAAIGGQDLGNINWIEIKPSAPLPTGTPWPTSWQTGASATEARFESTGTMMGGKIYAFGGFKDDQWRVWRTYASYDPAGNQWSQLGTLPVGMAESHMGITNDGTYIYIAGGFGGDLQPSQDPTQWVSDKVWRYDPVGNSWLQIATLPQARGAGALDIVGRDLHYFGGNPADRVTNVGTHWVYNLDAQQWRNAAAMPNPKDHFSTAVLNGKIYAFGGEHGHDAFHTQMSDLDIYDPVTDSWTDGASMPIAKSHTEAGTFVSDGKIIMAGGQVNDFQPTSNVIAYDPVADAWTTLASLPAARQGAIIQRIGNKVVIALGGVQTYQPQSNVWTGVLP